MISDLVDYGKWLTMNNQDGIGYMVNDDDYVLKISYDDENDNFTIEGIFKKRDANLDFYEKSVFNKILPTPRGSSDQSITIANNTGLMGFSPFLLNLDSDFIGRKIKPENYDNETNFYEVGSERYLLKKSGQKFNLEKTLGKFKTSLDSNKNNNQFNDKIVTKLFEDYEQLFLEKIPSEYQNVFVEDFFNKITSEEYVNLINKFYEFLNNNKSIILDMVIKFKLDNEVRNSRFFIVGIFGDFKDLINDLIFYYCKFVKTRNKSIENYDEGICSMPDCNNLSITYPTIPFYAADKKFYFNYSNDIKNSSLRLCDLCNRYMIFAFNNLKSNFKGNILIIPKTYDANYSEFLEIIQGDNNFGKINELLDLNSKKFTYDFLVYSVSNALLKIEKYIDNYQAFLTKFDDIFLYDNGKLNYFYNEIFVNDEDTLNDDNTLNKISNLFNFQTIFKELFYEVSGEQFKFPTLFDFYQIYYMDLTGDQGIFKGFSSKTINIFTKYKDDIFSFIYEVNFDAINKKMINEIVLNSLVNFQRNSIKKSHRFNIVKRLNYLFMFKREFLGDNMLSNENVLELRKIFGHPRKIVVDGNEKLEVVFGDVEEKQVFELISDDKAIKYYLMGQLISYIDIFKHKSGKKSEVFTHFITNVNRNNVKKLWVTEILQKNVFYINQMGKKGKFLFSIFESDLDSLFDDEGLNYEDYILLLFTGYYTTNILRNKYNFEGDD